jgi:hypothetical protein
MINLTVQKAPPIGIPPQITPAPPPSPGVLPPRQPPQPKVHSTAKQVIWNASDEDGDQLVYRLYYRASGARNWIPITKQPLLTTNYRWEISSIPDGKYTLMVEVSDEKSNVKEEVLKDRMESMPFIIDNTPPRITFEIKDLLIDGEVFDSTSNITRIEYRVDAGEWISIFPKDGIFDALKEKFRVKIEGTSKGVHTVTIRAFDEEINIGSTSKEFEVK